VLLSYSRVVMASTPLRKPAATKHCRRCDNDNYRDEEIGDPCELCCCTCCLCMWASFDCLCLHCSTFKPLCRCKCYKCFLMEKCCRSRIWCHPVYYNLRSRTKKKFRRVRIWHSLVYYNLRSRAKKVQSRKSHGRDKSHRS
jgi:hypothetical protein